MPESVEQAIVKLKEFLVGSQDNFGNLIANGTRDVINIPGQYTFTPERQRYFDDGVRKFLQYGTTSKFSETNPGHLLQPGSDNTLTIHSAERAVYRVGSDLIPSMARAVNGTLQEGDAIGGGFGNPDLANFDPVNEEWTGTDADGWLWIHTADTGLDEVLLVEVQEGTVVDKTRAELKTGAGTLGIVRQMLNYYDVGPSKFFESNTQVELNREEPQFNNFLSSVANDDGEGPATGNKRLTMQIHQAAGNSGLELNAGSMAVQTPADTPNYKDKEHTMRLTATNGTEGTYEVAGAMKVDNTREEVQALMESISISELPTNANNVEILVQAVSPDNTNYDVDDFEVPDEHSEKNSVIRQVEGDGAAGDATGPNAAGAGTDIDGADTAATLSNPGGYQLSRAVTRQDNNTKNLAGSSGDRQRVLTDADYALIFLDADDTGTVKIEVATRQNS